MKKKFQMTLIALAGMAAMSSVATAGNSTRRFDDEKFGKLLGLHNDDGVGTTVTGGELANAGQDPQTVVNDGAGGEQQQQQEQAGGTEQQNQTTDAGGDQQQQTTAEAGGE